MFQLLIFFMLVSNLSTFSLLPLSQGAMAGGATQSETTAVPSGTGQTAIWTLSRDSILAGGQRFDLTQLNPLAAGAKTAGTVQVLLVSRSDAEVQSVVRVLEALARNGLTSVQLAATRPVADDRPQP